jgi:hypothetical protein
MVQSLPGTADSSTAGIRLRLLHSTELHFMQIALASAYEVEDPTFFPSALPTVQA